MSNQSDRGSKYVEHGKFREVVGPERLVFGLTQEDGRQTDPETLVTVTCDDQAVTLSAPGQTVNALSRGPA